MHYFFIDGTFTGYGFIYQNENSPENLCFIPLSSLKQKKIRPEVPKEST